jgi:hypothetical protein
MSTNKYYGKKMKEGGISVSSRYHTPLTAQQIAETNALSPKARKAALNTIRGMSAIGSMVPLPVVQYPSIAINSAIGAYDTYNDLKEGDTDKAAFDAFTALPLPYVNKGGLPKKIAEKVMRYNLFSGATNLIGAGDDLQQAATKKYGGTVMQNKKMKAGGPANHFWNGDRWVSSAGDSGTYSNGVYYANGGPVFPVGGSAPVFGSGGIHIDKNKRGTFTAAATKHGKSVQEFASQVLANKQNYSPAMVKKANFARNAKSFKHEYGGPANHPLARYMAYGGAGPDGRDPNEETNVPAYTQQPAGDPNSIDPANFAANNAGNPYTQTSAVAPIAPQQQGAWAYNSDGSPMNDQQMQQNIDQRGNMTAPTQTKNRNMWGANMLGTGLAALGIGAAYQDRRNSKRDMQQNFQNRQSQNAFAPVNQPGQMGDYSQYGVFRPDQRVPTNTGFFQPSMKMGGAVKQKIRITAIPGMEMATGGYANQGASRGYGFQQPGSGYALDRRWGTTSGYPGTESQVDPYAKVGRTLPESDNPDIVVEKQEQILGDFDQDGKQELMGVDVGTHASGQDIPVNVPSNSFVFSDTKALKIKDPEIQAMFNMPVNKKGYTPAQIAKKYDLNKFKSITDDPLADELSKKTAQLMSDNYMAKLNKLAMIQESMKGGPVNQQPQQQGFVQAEGNMSTGDFEMMQPPMQYGGAPMYWGGGDYLSPSSGTAYDLPKRKRNNSVIGLPKDQAAKLLNGNDRVPYTPELAASIGYDGRYGHDVWGLQKWEQEEASGYPVSPGDGKPDGILGVRTLSPPMYRGVDPWENQHETPAIPGAPINDLATPASPLTQERKMAASTTPDKTPEQKGKNKWFNNIATGVNNMVNNPNFLGDVTNLTQMAQLKKFQPYEPVPQAVIPQAVYMDPTRAIAAQQELAQTTMQNNAVSGNSRAARANTLAIQGQAGAQAANTIGEYANQNVGIANTANQQAAAVTNQLMEKQANRLAELNKAGFLADRDYKREMGRLQAEYVGRKQQQHDTNVKTTWLNKTSPYFDINPVTQMPVFKSEKAKAEYEKMYNGANSGPTKSITDLQKYYVSQGASSDEARKLALESFRKSSGLDNETSTRTKLNNQTITEKNQYGGPHMQYGGVPQYDLGGGFLPVSSGIDPFPMRMPQQPAPKYGNSTEEFPVAKTGDIAARTNNPGNMIYSPRIAKMFGAVDSGIKQTDGTGHFAAFPDLGTGLNAYQTQLFGDTDGVMKSKYYKSNTPVDQALRKWSNNGYGADIFPQVAGKTLGQLSSAERSELAKRQIKRESPTVFKLLKDRGVFQAGSSPLQKYMK